MHLIIVPIPPILRLVSHSERRSPNAPYYRSHVAARYELCLLQLEGARLLAAECGDERVARVEDAEAGADEPHQDDGDVDGLLVPA